MSTVTTVQSQTFTESSSSNHTIKSTDHKKSQEQEQTQKQAFLQTIFDAGIKNKNSFIQGTDNNSYLKVTESKDSNADGIKDFEELVAYLSSEDNDEILSFIDDYEASGMFNAYDIDDDGTVDMVAYFNENGAIVGATRNSEGKISEQILKNAED